MAKKTITTKKKATPAKRQVNWAPGMPFGKFNYILMLAGFVVMFIGYILLSGGGSEDPTVFSEEIFNTRRLVIAPITLMAGFLIEFAAIMIKIGTKKEEQETPEN
ncbi:MAG: DUF3098 domain-containing protein [Bacteroidales bacterium]|jgi:uncharacterized membrane protein|nr:DUF3098 domain-containing protein [Bacteroidales bacterium]